LQKAFSVGINHWDTADVYGDGRSEQIIGTLWDEIPRNDIFIATKVGWDMGPHNHWYHPEHMRANMERSLKNLKTDCVDLMYLHHCNFGKQEQYFDDAVETIRRFQAEGKTRFIGLSDWSSDKVMNFIERVDPDVIQPYRNVMDDTYEVTGLKNYVEANNLGICFFSPIKHGLLTGKYKEPTTFETGDFRATVKEFTNQELIEKMQVNKEKLEEHFSDHPQPVMHGLVDALLTDVPTGCVLLGQRNVVQVEAAAQLGDALSIRESGWVKSLY
jgi:aryl-alcohol dehydrogenase-like predicted oxidoreductase